MVFHTNFYLALYCLSVGLLWDPAIGTGLTPEQIHLALGNNVHDIVVTWNTANHSLDEKVTVNYGIGDQLDQVAEGTSNIFFHGGDLNRTVFIHTVTLPDLKPNSTYSYNCGSKFSNFSKTYQFKTFPEGPNWSPHLCIFGDLGIQGVSTISMLINETQLGLYDAIVHVGDIAYDLNSYNGATGDQYMRNLEPALATLPYMVSPGNHENYQNFSHYRARYNMPGDSDNYYYSYNVGPVHIISFSTELYFFKSSGNLTRQYNWLIEDLENATKPENRKNQPWIMTLGHRPMYCTSDNTDECRYVNNAVRIGEYGLEDLFYNYGVDIEIWAHEHTYERPFPIYNYTVYNGSLEEPYVNPKAPVHILTGSPGNSEGHDQFVEPQPEWIATRCRNISYTRFKAYNSTHVHFEQVYSLLNGEVFDEFWLVKDNHGPYKNMLTNLPIPSV